MIERLKDSSGFGFKATGSISADDIKAIEPQIERQIAENRKHPIGILIDFTALKDVEWKARWEELRFLSKYGGPIAPSCRGGLAQVGRTGWRHELARPC